MGHCVSVRHHISAVDENDDVMSINKRTVTETPSLETLVNENEANEPSAISASKPSTPTNVKLQQHELCNPPICKADASVTTHNQQNANQHDTVSIEQHHGTDGRMDDNSKDSKDSKDTDDSNIKHSKTSSSDHELSEIKDQTASDSRSKSKKLRKYRCNKPLKYYGSSSSSDPEQSLIDINIKDSDSESVGSYFESITKLTAITNMGLENMNSSGDETMIEKTISMLSSIPMSGESIDNRDSIESVKGSSCNHPLHDELKLNVTSVSSSGPQIRYNRYNHNQQIKFHVNDASSSGPQIKYRYNDINQQRKSKSKSKSKSNVNEISSSGPKIKYVHNNKQCAIQNPFYHSDDTESGDNDNHHEDGGSGDDDDDIIFDDDTESILSDDTGSYTSYNWYQSFDPESINNINNINKNKGIIKIKQNSGHDKIKRIDFCPIIKKPRDSIATFTPTIGSKYNLQYAPSITITPTNTTNHYYPDSMKANKSSSSFNSIRAQISSSNVSMATTMDTRNDTEIIETVNHNPFRVTPILKPPPCNTPIHSSDTDCIDTSSAEIEFSQNEGGIVLPIKWLNKQSVASSPYYQYTHYNTINGWYEQSEKRKSRQISIQRTERRACPPPHSFNYYSNNDNDRSDFDEEDDVQSTPSNHSTHI